MRCSLLNFSNRRRASFFYKLSFICTYLVLFRPFYNLHTPFLTPFLLEFPRLSSLLFSPLCNSFFVSALYLFLSIKYLTKRTDIWQRRIIGNSCIIIVSNVMRCSRFNPSSINNRESTRGFRVFIQNNFVKYLMVLRRNLVIVDKKIKMLTFFFYIIIID